MNPSDREVWANDCHGRAFDPDGNLLFEFTIPWEPGGVHVGPHGRYAGKRTVAIAPTSAKIVAEASRVTAECAAWDWGDYPPV